MTLGERILTARKLRGFTLYDVASAVGVHVSTIQRYENDRYDNPKLPVIESIAHVLNVNPSWLIGKSDDMEPPRASDDGLAALSPDEQELLDHFRALNADGRRRVTDYAADLDLSGRYGKKSSRSSADAG